jgi:hypothetical protein
MKKRVKDLQVGDEFELYGLPRKVMLITKTQIFYRSNDTHSKTTYPSFGRNSNQFIDFIKSKHERPTK